MKPTITFSVLVLTLLFDSTSARGRIYGGHQIDITNAPYMAHIFIIKQGGRAASCGGTILRTNLILTAGHYGEIKKSESYRVHVGSTNPRGGVRHMVKNVYPHPKYKGPSDDHRHHDVALLELVDDIELNENSQLVKLALKNDTVSCGTEAIASGWGDNPEHPKDSRLYQVHLKIASPNKCADYFGHQNVKEFRQHEICVQTPDKNVCKGDSGGPLIDTTTNRQIGTVSYGPKDCSIVMLNVFSRVTDNLDFIDEIISKTSTRTSEKNQLEPEESWVDLKS